MAKPLVSFGESFASFWPVAGDFGFVSRRATAAERLDRLHHAAQFGQALQAADERVAGVDALLAVVAEEVAVVGAHRDFSVDPPFRAPAPLFGHQRRDETDHIGFAAEV